MILYQNAEGEGEGTRIGMPVEFKCKEINRPQRRPPSWVGVTADGRTRVYVEPASVAESVSTPLLSSDPSAEPPPPHF